MAYSECSRHVIFEQCSEDLECPIKIEKEVLQEMYGESSHPHITAKDENLITLLDSPKKDTEQQEELKYTIKIEKEEFIQETPCSYIPEFSPTNDKCLAPPIDLIKKDTTQPLTSANAARVEAWNVSDVCSTVPASQLHNLIIEDRKNSTIGQSFEDNVLLKDLQVVINRCDYADALTERVKDEKQQINYACSSAKFKIQKDISILVGKKKPGTLLNGIQTQAGEKPFGCESCSARFTQRNNLVRHIRTHTGEKPFVCDTCSASFSQRSHLVYHIRTHIGEKPFGCDSCSSRFTRRYDLAKHIRTHTGEKPFECDYCSAKFTHRSSLSDHTRMHTGEKPYQCDSCSAKFTQRSNLIRHIRSHSGEKPFKCEFCSARFTQRSSLVDHTRTHTGVKPFECDSCPAKFTKKSSLTDHIRTHTGEKPFECHSCKARFALKGSLVNHLRTHTGEKPFECDYCSAKFSRKSHLIGHFRTHTA